MIIAELQLIEQVPIGRNMSVGTMALLECRKHVRDMEYMPVADECHGHVHVVFQVEDEDYDRLVDQLNAWHTQRRSTLQAGELIADYEDD